MLAWWHQLRCGPPGERAAQQTGPACIALVPPAPNALLAAGLGTEPVISELDLDYKERYPNVIIPDVSGTACLWSIHRRRRAPAGCQRTPARASRAACKAQSIDTLEPISPWHRPTRSSSWTPSAATSSFSCAGKQAAAARPRPVAGCRPCFAARAVAYPDTYEPACMDAETSCARRGPSTRHCCTQSMPSSCRCTPMRLGRAAQLRQTSCWRMLALCVARSIPGRGRRLDSVREWRLHLSDGL